MNRMIIFAFVFINYICMSNPMNSMLAIKHNVVDDQGFRNPYITKGLIAMWDGEWNSDLGVHDPNITEWIDISGNGHTATFNKDYVVGENYIYLHNQNGNNNNKVIVDPGWAFGAEHTQEIVMMLPTGVPSGFYRIMSDNRGLEIREGHRGFYGYNVDFNITTEPFPENIIFTACARIFYPYEGAGSLRCKYYENGTALGVERLYISNSTLDSPFAIGGRPGTTSGRNPSIFLFCIRIYNRALSENEIMHNAIIDQERFGL